MEAEVDCPIHINVRFLHTGDAMRTNIDIDDSLLKKVMRSSKSRTKKAAVDTALRRYMQMQEQEKALRELWGAAKWEGDLEQSRLGRFADRQW